MYSEDDLLPISALQHLTFCRRQCALIHIEQLWVDNIFTAQGNVLHERVHDEKRESRRDVRLEHGMPLRSLRLGLVGKGDVVEFHRDVSGKSWRPFPVEYKRGRNKEEECDRVQLCAQALCLEEMLGVGAASGAIYYGKDRRRVEVFFDEVLRRTTEDKARELHEFIRAGQTPRPVYEKKCDTCSLYKLCLPKIMEKNRSVRIFLAGQLES